MSLAKLSPSMFLFVIGFVWNLATTTEEEKNGINNLAESVFRLEISSQCTLTIIFFMYVVANQRLIVQSKFLEAEMTLNYPNSYLKSPVDMSRR